MSHNIYYIFCNTKIIFKVWKALEYKYGTKEKDLKKYSVEKWLDFQMVDEKSVLIKSMSLKILFMTWKLREWNYFKLFLFYHIKNNHILGLILLEV